MKLPDVNVLIYAHRQDAPDHRQYAAWLQRLVESPEPFALPPIVASGFLRIVTNRRIFKPATPMDVAIGFCERLVQWPRSIPVTPGENHWTILVDLLRSAEVKGGLVSDAYLAALALEHGCEVVTTDSDFDRFPGVRWHHPLAAGPRPS